MSHLVTFFPSISSSLNHLLMNSCSRSGRSQQWSLKQLSEYQIYFNSSVQVSMLSNQSSVIIKITTIIIITFKMIIITIVIGGMVELTVSNTISVSDSLTSPLLHTQHLLRDNVNNNNNNKELKYIIDNQTYHGCF